MSAHSAQNPGLNQDEATPRATRREWIGLAVIALPCLLYAMDLTVLNLAVPHLIADLQPGAAELLWIVDIYGFMVAGSLMTMGTLGDRIGRRRLLLTGAVVFGIASVVAAFSSSAEMLIVNRALMGIAGATLAPSTLSLIRNMFLDEGQRRIAIGVWISSFSAGGAVGPVFGGLLLEHFAWGSVFLMNVPVMLLLLAVGPFLLPEYKDPNAGRIDLPSAGLSLVAVLAVIYGLKRVAEGGVGWEAAAAVLIGLAVGTVFVRRQKRLADPFIDLSLFRSAAFRTALTVNMLGCFFLFGTFLFLSQYLQLVAGLSPLQAGLWLLPSALSFVAGSVIVPMMAQRVSAAVLMASGLAVAAVGFAVLTQLDGDTSLMVLVVGTVIFSLGFTPVVSLTTDIVVSAAPPERAGSAAALSETSLEFGGALGIAVLGSVATAMYRGRMADAAASLPPEVAETARSALGGAVQVAQQVPAERAAPLLEAAHNAFAAGIQLNAAMAVLGLLALATLVLIRLRKLPVVQH